MLDEVALRKALAAMLPAGALVREFVVRDGAGRMRIGALARDAGVYAEVSNFLAPGRDYCVADGAVAGLYRFSCEGDLFYSDIGQTMTMSEAAAQRALAAAG